jgi:hypothetical protein
MRTAVLGTIVTDAARRHAVAALVLLLVASAVAMLGPSAAAHAAARAPLEQSAAPATCDTPEHHRLDFWLGDWQVFDGTTNELVALDHIEKHSEGCIIQQTMTFVTDLYRRPGIGHRLAGMSISRFDGEQWVQMWADNQWGAILFRAAPEAAGSAGSMVFVTAIPSRKRDVKLVYESRPDGSVRIQQYVAPFGSGKWVQYGDLIYRPNR